MGTAKNLFGSGREAKKQGDNAAKLERMIH